MPSKNVKKSVKKEYAIPNEIQYENYNLSFINKEQAVAIASCDRNLKESIFQEGIKNNLYYGLIKFKSFKIGLVKYMNSTFYWHIIVKECDWDGIEKKLFHKIMCDGCFTENDNISCIVSCDNGEYFYKNEFNIDDLFPASFEEYENYCNYSNFWVSSDSKINNDKKNMQEENDENAEW